VKNHQALKEQVAKQVARMKQAEKDRPTLLAQTAYIGTLGLLFVLPIVAGAYFGDWLDSQFEGYSILWTMSMIFLGVIVGAVNVYLFIRE
jgi:ATP synthase protein I